VWQNSDLTPQTTPSSNIGHQNTPDPINLLFRTLILLARIMPTCFGMILAKNTEEQKTFII
jgi:hypothetical protein